MSWRRRSLAPARAADRGQPLAALAVNSTTSLVAGLFLGAMVPTFERLSGLLVLVPAAIGLRGNVFSAFGSRLSTAVHTGTFVASRRRGTVVVENVLAALALTSGVSLVLAAAAWVVTGLVLPGAPAPVLDLVTISVVGGLGASLVVLAATVALAVLAAARDWDLDDLVAPVVSTLGDVLTLPALWLATHLVGHGRASTGLGVVVVGATAVATVGGLTSRHRLQREVCRQSAPVLVLAGLASLAAGLVIEHRLADLGAATVVLVLLPAFVSSAGALGGIVAARTATALHLGTRRVGWWPDHGARQDLARAAVLAVPVLAYDALGAQLLAGTLDGDDTGLVRLAVVTAGAGLVAVGYALGAAHVSGVTAVRLRLDPDTVGIPAVTSTVDLVGALALTTTAVALGLVA